MNTGTKVDLENTKTIFLESVTINGVYNKEYEEICSHAKIMSILEHWVLCPISIYEFSISLIENVAEIANLSCL